MKALVAQGVSLFLASSQNTMKRRKRRETPIPSGAGGDQSWGREDTAPGSAFLLFPSTLQASQARTNEAEQGWEPGANLTCRNQEELPKAAQPQKSRGNREGDETPPTNLPTSSSVPQFPLSNAETHGDLWPCMNPPLADRQNNHIPKEYRIKKNTGNIPKSSVAAEWGQQGPPPSALHPSLKSGARCKRLELQRSPSRMNGAVCALGQIYPGSPGTGRAGAILGKLPRCN